MRNAGQCPELVLTPPSVRMRTSHCSCGRQAPETDQHRPHAVSSCRTGKLMLVMIEAMACGTPVIAFRRGSVPEIVEHGVSGFVVDHMDSAAEAVAEIHTLPRAE